MEKQSQQVYNSISFPGKSSFSVFGSTFPWDCPAVKGTHWMELLRAFIFSDYKARSREQLNRACQRCECCLGWRSGSRGLSVGSRRGAHTWSRRTRRKDVKATIRVMQGAGEQLRRMRTQFPYAHPFPESPLVFLKLKKKNP